MDESAENGREEIWDPIVEERELFSQFEQDYISVPAKLKALLRDWEDPELKEEHRILSEKYGFDGFHMYNLGQGLKFHPAKQWRWGISAAKRLQKIGRERGKIQVHPIGHGGEVAWKAFEEFMFKPRDGSKPVVELNYEMGRYENDLEQHLNHGLVKQSPTGEYRPIMTSAKRVRVPGAPVLLLVDDWCYTGDSLWPGPLWGLQNAARLGVNEAIYSLVFRDVVNLTTHAVLREENPKTNYRQSIVAYPLMRRDKDGNFWMQKTYKYFKKNGLFSQKENLYLVGEWGPAEIEALERKYLRDI